MKTPSCAIGPGSKVWGAGRGPAGKPLGFVPFSPGPGRVSWHDPHVTALKGFEQLTRVPAVKAETLASADCVVIATDHTAYDWEAVVKHSRLVVDSRNATRQVTVDRHKIVRL